MGIPPSLLRSESARIRRRRPRATSKKYSVEGKIRVGLVWGLRQELAISEQYRRVGGSRRLRITSGGVYSVRKTGEVFAADPSLDLSTVPLWQGIIIVASVAIAEGHIPVPVLCEELVWNITVILISNRRIILFSYPKTQASKRFLTCRNRGHRDQVMGTSVNGAPDCLSALGEECGDWQGIS